MEQKNDTTRPWDAAEHLETEDDMAAYLDAALEDGDATLVVAALGDIARAKGMSQIAREAGLGAKVSTRRFPRLATRSLRRFSRSCGHSDCNFMSKQQVLEAPVLWVQKNVLTSHESQTLVRRYERRSRGAGPNESETMSETYVHGYHLRENERLQDQAGALVDLLHADTAYPAGAGCSRPGAASARRRSPWPSGVLMRDSRQWISPQTRSPRPGAGPTRRASPTSSSSKRTSSPCPSRPSRSTTSSSVSSWSTSSRPVEALAILKRLLRPGGTITVIEGDHGSTYFYPDSPAAHAAIQCQVTMQREAGGNALIGRQVYPLLVEAGFDAVRVSPRMVYADASRPALVDGFTRKTFTAMIEGIRDSALAAGLIEPERFDAGVRALHRTTEADGVFCYTFFKGVGEKGRGA